MTIRMMLLLPLILLVLVIWYAIFRALQGMANCAFVAVRWLDGRIERLLD